MKTATKKPVLHWTGYADDEMITDYAENYNSEQEEGDNVTLEEAGEMLACDSDYWQVELECFYDWLTELMDGREYWRDDATRLGWMSRTGYKVFKATDALEFLRAISPDTDCSYTITPYYKGFKVRIAHHDAPTGESHIIRPISEEVYDKEEA
jgi:hypothetical protein